MEKRIILVGCGNIGSRHLQAIAKLPYGIKVDIVEPSDKKQIISTNKSYLSCDIKCEKCEPIKPAPPVTKILLMRFISYLSSTMKTIMK